MKIGDVQFNVDAFKDTSEEEFILLLKGKPIGIDIREAYKLIRTQKEEIKPKKAPKRKK